MFSDTTHSPSAQRFHMRILAQSTVIYRKRRLGPLLENPPKKAGLKGTPSEGDPRNMSFHASFQQRAGERILSGLQNFPLVYAAAPGSLKEVGSTRGLEVSTMWQKIVFPWALEGATRLQLWSLFMYFAGTTLWDWMAKATAAGPTTRSLL